MTHTTIRRVFPKESPRVLRELASLNARCFPADDSVNFLAGSWWIAYHGTAPVGFVGVHEGSLVRYGVAPTARLGGIGRRLLRVAIAGARRIGWKSLETYTLPHNAPSMRALIAVGFRPVDRRTDERVYWSLNL